MPDEPAETAAGGQGRTAAAAGGGVLAGAGLPTGLFGTIGMGKIFAGTNGYSAAFPLVVFSLAALFLLTAALFTIQVTRTQRSIAFAGMGCFVLMALVGAGSIFWQDYRRPTITVTQLFEPVGLTGNGMESPKLQLVYRTVRNGGADYAPYRNDPSSIAGGDVLSFKMVGLEELLRQYKNDADQNDNAFRMLSDPCKHEKQTLVCEEISGLKTTMP